MFFSFFFGKKFFCNILWQGRVESSIICQFSFLLILRNILNVVEQILWHFNINESVFRCCSTYFMVNLLINRKVCFDVLLFFHFLVEFSVLWGVHKNVLKFIICYDVFVSCLSFKPILHKGWCSEFIWQATSCWGVLMYQRD